MVKKDINFNRSIKEVDKMNFSENFKIKLKVESGKFDGQSYEKLPESLKKSIKYRKLVYSILMPLLIFFIIFGIFIRNESLISFAGTIFIIFLIAGLLDLNNYKKRRWGSLFPKLNY